MKKLNKKALLFLLIIPIILIIVLVITYRPTQINTIKLSEEDSKKITKFIIARKEYNLKKGESLTSSFFNEDDIEIEYNDQKYTDLPVIYKDIQIGSPYQDVFNKFNIPNNYANVNMEIPNELHDGTTDIINEIYKENKTFQRDYLDAIITFGYIKQDGVWALLPYKDLTLLEKEDYNGDLLIFNIIINGIDDNTVPIGHIDAIMLEYN